jgi:hypothetical protein
MGSVLGRLFTFANTTEHAALENFTTEALAAAIRADGGPFALALTSIGIDKPLGFHSVLTQVAIERGVLDMVLEAGARNFVVEVKVGAGESGDAIDRYLEWSKKQPIQTDVVLLGPTPLRADVPWLSWQALRDAVRESGTLAPYWRDLVEFLKEIGMADDRFEPVRAGVVPSLADAHTLLLKTARILTMPARRANALWPGSKWAENESQIKQQITNRFRLWPSFTIQQQTTYRAGVSMGATAHADLGIWVWANPKRFSERAQIRKAAESAGLTNATGWVHDLAAWELVAAYKPLTDFETQDAASGWLVDRLEDLKRAGEFELIERLGAPAPDDRVGGEADGAGAT